MSQHVASFTLLVPGYDEAIAYFVDVLGFALTTDDERPGGDRWVVVTPRGGGPGFRLATARGDAEIAAIGHQAGARVLAVLYTDDLVRDHAAYVQRGVRFTEAPRREAYGLVAVFVDPFGNLWDLIQPETS
jgi:catechol 2,3-dioxygenase-like lactoylglutathione lyase family enzyme